MPVNWLDVGLLLHPSDDITAAKIAPSDLDSFYKSAGISMEQNPEQQDLCT